MFVVSSVTWLGNFLKFLATKFSYKSSPNNWWLFGLFWNYHFCSKNCCGYFLGNPRKKWASFYFNIWSHWWQASSQWRRGHSSLLQTKYFRHSSPLGSSKQFKADLRVLSIGSFGHINDGINNVNDDDDNNNNNDIRISPPRVTSLVQPFKFWPEVYKLIPWAKILTTEEIDLENAVSNKTIWCY